MRLLPRELLPGGLWIPGQGCGGGAPASPCASFLLPELGGRFGKVRATDTGWRQSPAGLPTVGVEVVENSLHTDS